MRGAQSEHLRGVTAATPHPVVPLAKCFQLGRDLEFGHPKHIYEYDTGNVREAVGVSTNKLAVREVLAEYRKESLDAVITPIRQLRYLFVRHGARQGPAFECGVAVAKPVCQGQETFELDSGIPLKYTSASQWIPPEKAGSWFELVQVDRNRNVLCNPGPVIQFQDRDHSLGVDRQVRRLEISTTAKINVLDFGGESFLRKKYSRASSTGGGGIAVELHLDPLSIVCARGEHLSNIVRRQGSRCRIGTAQRAVAEVWTASL
jgi:hypothetical protein